MQSLFRSKHHRVQWELLPAMSLLMALLALVAGLHLCVGDEKEDAFFATLSTDLPNIQEEIIDKHNDLRRQVNPHASNMLKMQWNATAAKNCKNWAAQCKDSHSDVNQRTIEGGIACGENLFSSSVPVLWPDVIQAWFNEEEDFIYAVGPKYEGAVIGHYTAVVWYNSYLGACAAYKCPQQELSYFYVCQYCPAGNVLGPNLYVPYKEGEPCGDCPNNCDAGLCTNPCGKNNNYTNCDSLKKGYTCEHPIVRNNCHASCQCTTEIK